MNKLTALFYKLRYLKNWYLVRNKFIKRPVKKYCGRAMTAASQNAAFEDLLSEIREGNRPVFMGRLGHTENFTMIDYEFIEAGLQKDYSDLVYRDAKKCSGMYPLTKEGLSVCADYQRNALENITHFVFWHLKMEPYWIKHYLRKDARLLNGDDPFKIMEALKGKRVLVVSSFTSTIVSQYQKRKFLFPDESYLPEFKLIVEKAPVTYANVEPVFSTWEESLLDCYNRCIQHSFDVVLIGAGSYSMPLGNLLFKRGAQVIVLNSSIQMVFGMKGRRWETQPWAVETRKLFSEYWGYPSIEETPAGYEGVDPGSGYWK